MSRGAADGATLLDLARSTLVDEMLDALPEQHRYPARMVANAMAIAAREVGAGEAAAARELEMLEGLYGGAAPGAVDVTVEARLETLNRRLAKDIRAGVLDGACAAGVRAVLLHQVRSALAISNPRYLARYDSETD